MTSRVNSEWNRPLTGVGWTSEDITQGRLRLAMLIMVGDHVTNHPDQHFDGHQCPKVSHVHLANAIVRLVADLPLPRPSQDGGPTAFLQRVLHDLGSVERLSVGEYETLRAFLVDREEITHLSLQRFLGERDLRRSRPIRTGHRRPTRATRSGASDQSPPTSGGVTTTQLGGIGALIALVVLGIYYRAEIGRGAYQGWNNLTSTFTRGSSHVTG